MSPGRPCGVLWFAAGLRHDGRAPHTPCAGDGAVHAAVSTSGSGSGLSWPASRHEAATLVEPATHPGRPAPTAGAKAGARLGAPRAVAPPLTLAARAQACMTGQAFRQCTACSPAVVGAYRARGWDFVREALEARALPRDTPCAAMPSRAVCAFHLCICVHGGRARQSSLARPAGELSRVVGALLEAAWQ